MSFYREFYEGFSQHAAADTGENRTVIVAAVVTAVGLFCVAAITQLFGYRLAGTITVPVLAIYTLRNVVTLPVFVVSAALAYLGLWVLKQRTLIYGRDELLAAIALGSALPIALLLVAEATFPARLEAVLFVGSILPGLAAFNYHRLKPQYRRGDALATVTLFAALLALGALLVSPTLEPVLGTLTPPVLYSEVADVAHWRNAAVAEDVEQVVLSRSLIVVLFGGALVASEAVRRRYDVRIGVISVGLLAVYALASAWLLALYAVLFASVYVSLQLMHRRTILYGRVLIGITTGAALIAAIPLVPQFPIGRGLSAYFVAVLAGISAYNVHATAPAYRVLIPPLQVAVLVPAVVVARYLGDALPAGIPQRLGPVELGVGFVAVVLCVGFAEYYTVSRPSNEEVHASSILSGGGET